MALLGSGDESCVFANGHHVISVLQKKPSAAYLMRVNAIHDQLLLKDPNQEYFVSGRIQDLSTAKFIESFPTINLGLCDGRIDNGTVYFTVMPMLAALPPTLTTGDYGQRPHIKRGLAILHSTINGSQALVHGDIKDQNIMMKIVKGLPMPVIIDFGHTHVSGDEPLITVENDSINLQSFLDGPPRAPPRPARGRSRSPDRRSRSRERGRSSRSRSRDRSRSRSRGRSRDRGGAAPRSPPRARRSLFG